MAVHQIPESCKLRSQTLTNPVIDPIFPGLSQQPRSRAALPTRTVLHLHCPAANLHHRRYPLGVPPLVPDHLSLPNDHCQHGHQVQAQLLDLRSPHRPADPVDLLLLADHDGVCRVYSDDRPRRSHRKSRPDDGVV
uniref:(northern house mosquito) hypothetical protein n=1 Tax=Culex pipiens TaxID=7175 RepID=A0A8D8AE32_CULPI